jgi:hypothetical protein
MAAAPSSPTNSELSAVPPQTPPLSEGARLVNVFIAPSKTFTDLRRNAMWWAPIVLMVIVSIGFVFVAGQKVGFRKIAENQLQMQPKQADALEKMPPAEREHQMDIREKFTKWIGYGFSAFQVIFLLIVAGILFGTFKIAGGSDVTFKASMAVVVYASLPGIVRAILTIITLLAGASPDSFTFQNPIGSNIGYYLNPTDSPFLYSLGTSFDLFTLWTLALTAIGFTCISKVKKGTAFAVVYGWWLLVVLVGAGLAAAFS